jgi:hypothetical protein
MKSKIARRGSRKNIAVTLTDSDLLAAMASNQRLTVVVLSEQILGEPAESKHSGTAEFRTNLRAF